MAKGSSILCLIYLGELDHRLLLVVGMGLLVVGVGACNKLEPGPVALNRCCVGRNDASASRMAHFVVGMRRLQNTEKEKAEMNIMVSNKERSQPSVLE